LYVSLVEQPARLACDVDTALNQWRPSYNKAAILQIILSVLSVITSIALYFISKDIFLLMAGLILLIIAPLTLIIMHSCIKQLSDPARTGTTPGTMPLIKKWGRLHNWRTVISLTALILQVLHMYSLIK